MLSSVLATGALAQSVTPPEVLESPPAEYPVDATTSATVVTIVTVDATGHVTAAEVVESAGKAFDDAALAAVRRWTFRPALRNGQPFAARIRIPFRFEPPTAQVPAADAGTPPTPSGTPEGPPTVTPIAPPPTEPTPPPPGEVTVRGTRRVERGGSDFQIEIGKLSVITNNASASDVLLLAPGIFIANEGGQGHADQVFLRGFNLEQGQSMEFTVNGVPINDVDNPDGHGYADYHFIIPELVKNLRVIEGPFDPHQGDFAVAGSADFQLGVVERGVRLQGGLGNYGTKRALGIVAPPGEREGTFLGMEYSSSDGWGTNRAYSSFSAIGQYEGELGERGLWHLLATAYSDHYRSAGVLRRDDIGSVGFYGTLDPSQGGDAQRYTLAADVQSPLAGGTAAQQVFLTYRSHRLVENFTGFLLDTQEIGQSLHDQRGDARQQAYNAVVAGGRGSYRTSTTLLGQEQSLEVGYYARYDHTTPQSQRLRFGTQIPYKGIDDFVIDTFNLAGYVDLDLRPLSWLSLRGGVRQEYFSYNVLLNCATSGNYNRGQPLDVDCPAYDRAGPRLPETRVSASGSILEPKVTAIARVHPWISMTASYGVGAASSDARFVFQNAEAPFSKLQGAEGGVLFRRQSALLDLSARAIGYWTHVDHDLIFDPQLGRLDQTNGTTRRGFVGALRATGVFLDESASVTYAYATFDDTGLLVPYVPAWVARSDTSLFGAIPGLRIADRPITGTLGLRLSYVGSRALPFSQTAAGNFVVDIAGTLRWRFVEIGTRISNLFNREYARSEFFYASDFHTRSYATLAPASHFSAAAPREYLVTLALIFDQVAQ
jgi:iron complex outermembrane receptor protein